VQLEQEHLSISGTTNKRQGVSPQKRQQIPQRRTVGAIVGTAAATAPTGANSAAAAAPIGQECTVSLAVPQLARNLSPAWLDSVPEVPKAAARWMTTAATTSPKITHFTRSTSTNLPKYQKLHDSTYLEGNSVAESDSCSLIFLHLSIFIRFAIKLSGQFSMRQID
jgi:hypothetical protein